MGFMRLSRYMFPRNIIKLSAVVYELSCAQAFLPNLAMVKNPKIQSGDFIFDLEILWVLSCCQDRYSSKLQNISQTPIKIKGMQVLSGRIGNRTQRNFFPALATCFFAIPSYLLYGRLSANRQSTTSVWYINNHPGHTAFYPSEVGESSTSLHGCSWAGACAPIWEIDAVFCISASGWISTIYSHSSTILKMIQSCVHRHSKCCQWELGNIIKS